MKLGKHAAQNNQLKINYPCRYIGHYFENVNISGLKTIFELQLNAAIILLYNVSVGKCKKMQDQCFCSCKKSAIYKLQNTNL